MSEKTVGHAVATAIFSNDYDDFPASHCDLRGHFDAYRGERTFKQVVDIVNNQLEGLRDQLSDVTTERNRLVGDINHVGGRMVSLEYEVNDLRKQLDRVVAQRDTIQGSFEELIFKAAMMENELKELKRKRDA